MPSREPLDRLKELFEPPVFEDQGQTLAARLARTVLLIILGLVVLQPLTVWIFSPADLGMSVASSATMLVVALGSMALLRYGYARQAGLLLTAAFYVIFTAVIFRYGGIHSLAVTGYFIVIILASLLLGPHAALAAGIACILAVGGAYYAEIAGLIDASAASGPPHFQLVGVIVMFGLAALFLWLAMHHTAQTSEKARLGSVALGEAYKELESSRDVLQARTSELERHSAYLEAAAEVAQAASSILEIDLLIQRVVDLIRDRFGLYYVGLFLLDETKDWAVLRAGTGQAGRAMLARAHRIAVGEGMVGWCIAHRQARIALEAGRDAVRLVMLELPDTKSEAALPLRSRGQILGAISVQHNQPHAFDPQTVIVLQMMADQIAVALDNARLFAEGQAALEAERRAYGEISRQAWTEMVRSRRELGYVCQEEGLVRPASGPWQADVIEMSQAAETSVADSTILTLPITIREHNVGAIRLRKAEGAKEWTAEEINLMETLIRQLEVALESARLYQDTQHRAVRDRLLAEIGGRVRQTLDVDAVLRTAASEIRQALSLPEVAVRLKGQPEDNGLSGAERGG